MIYIKSSAEIAKMKVSGRIVYDTLCEVEKHIQAGITTKELDQIARNYILSQGAKPSFLNYNGYPASICASINEVVIHGIPSSRKLKDGDIIIIDIPSRSINVKLSDEELAAREQQPLKRKRTVSKALRAYAQSVSSADKGGVRIIE